MELVYIGDQFYSQSRTMMSCIYTEKGERSDWGKVTNALQEGQEVHIRPANNRELVAAYRRLEAILNKRNAC